MSRTLLSRNSRPVLSGIGRAVLAAALFAAFVAPASAAENDRVRAAVREARSLRSQGRFEEAIAVLERAVREGPYDENLHYLLGQMMEAHSTPRAMVEFFSQEVERDQKPQSSHYFWAVGLARQGDIDGAIAQLQKALEIDPAHEMSQRQWGLLLERRGQREEALEHLVEATRIHPEYKSALRDAARLARELGRTAEAEEYEKRAAGANPNTLRQYVYWARYLHEHGRDGAALAEVERMLAAQPNDAEALALHDQIRAAMSGGGRFSGQSAGGTPTAAPANAGGQGISSEARALLIAKLSTRPPGTKAWITYDTRDPVALALARDLAACFEEARWIVRKLDKAPFPLRPGIFLMAADHPPSDASSAVADALDAARLEAKVASGYRAYAEERKRADAAWHGFDLEPDQDFMLAIGRRAPR